MHETQLSETYGASRTPIREALNWLAHDGLLERAARRLPRPVRYGGGRHRDLRGARGTRIRGGRRCGPAPHRPRHGTARATALLVLPHRR
ncbi:GntR family transcriptional regulator [Prescottella defluvii]|nr:GntR family transcriptional regulator [Prescottella defluvii]